MDLCNNIGDDDDFIVSVNSLKKYLASNVDGNPKEFKEVYLDNHYLNQKYAELSRNDKSNIDDFMDSNKNLYDILNIVRMEDSQILIQQFQEFLNVSSIFALITPEAFFKMCENASYSPCKSLKKCSVPFGRFKIACKFIISVQTS